MTRKKITNSSLKKKRYSNSILIFTVGGYVLTALLLYLSNALKTPNEYTATVVNLIICITNLIAGLLIIEDAVKKSNKTFVIEFFGSMMVRMLMILIYVVLAVKLFGFPVVNFIFSFFGFYVFSLIFELNYLSKITKKEINKGEDNI
jgi:hypothetical protein